MKRNLLFLLMALLPMVACINATAQINHPLVEEGKVWYYKGIYSWGGYKVWEEIYSLEGDTVIDSHQCLKLYLTCNNPRKSYDHDYIGAMYEKGGKVYYIVPDNTTSAVLYDFSCDVGDKITMNLYDIYMPNIVKYDEFDMIINDKQLVEYRDENLTVMNWSPFFKLTEDVVGFCTIWIEGVGSPLDLLNSTPVWYSGIYSSRELLTCKLNDQIIYDRDDFWTSALVVTDITKPSVQQSDNTKTIYDLQGRKLLGKPARGIYIENGKKKVK